MIFDEEDYYSPSEVFTCMSSLSHSSSKKGNMLNKKRFSDEQVRSLETIFENETKLEPKKKVQLARELGLQPRQIAIWFQNKRARYKSKQLERDYNILRANYNSLSSRFDNLKKEKLSLLVQLEKLKNLVGKVEVENQCGNDSEVTNSEESRSEINKIDCNKGDQCEVKQQIPTLSIEGSEYGASMLSSDEGSSENNTNYFRMDEETDLLTMVQPIISDSLTSPQGWDDLHPNGLFDQPVDHNSQWLDFWS